MLKMNLDLHSYYLGIIKCKKEYYQKEKRYLTGVNMDPFAREDEEISTKVGVPTILIKEENTFRDVFYSRFKGELTYKMNKYNSKGIMLTYVKPFLDYYGDFSQYPMMYTETENSYLNKLQEYLPYLIFPHFDGSECIYLQDIDPLDNFYDRYVNDFCIEEEEIDIDDIDFSKKEEDPFSLTNYYIGIIVCDGDYYKRANSIRFYQNINFDPFQDMELEDSMKYGVPTLLYKDGDTFYDMMWKRYDKELSYHENTFNRFGIKLIHIEPFLKWYPFEDILKYPVITGIANNKRALELQEKMPFLANYNPKMNYFDLEIIDDTPMYTMAQDFYQKKGMHPFQKK